MAKKKLCGEQIVKKYWKDLKKVLLAIDGKTVERTEWDTFIGRIVSEGRLYGGERIICPGRPRHCQSDAATVWMRNRGRVQLCTGYAFSDDTWYQHSWCVFTHEGRHTLLETTPVDWTRYFGITLSHEEATWEFEEVVLDWLDEEGIEELFHQFPEDMKWAQKLTGYSGPGQ